MGNDIVAVKKCKTLAFAHARYISQKKVLQVLPETITHWITAPCGCILIFRKCYRKSYWQGRADSCTFVCFCAEMRHIEKSDATFLYVSSGIFHAAPTFQKMAPTFWKNSLTFWIISTPFCGLDRWGGLTGSTCSIFGSTSERPICTRKSHNASWLGPPVALVAPFFARNYARVGQGE